MMDTGKKTGQKPRFFYLIPAHTKNRLDCESRLQHLKRLLFHSKEHLPSGGVKIIYQSCDILKKNGYEAYPVHLGDFVVKWFPHETKAISDKKALSIIRESDILICPEIIPQAAAQFPCRNKIAYIQNWALVEIGTGRGKRYEDFYFTELMSCSEYIKEFMKARSNLPCTVIIDGIDVDVFHPAPEKRTKNSILYLSRKNIKDARGAIAKLPEDIRQKAGFIELENKYTQNEMTTFYQSADIFMATGYPEGFSLPPLEAMSCGCAVIGFAGIGGLEHMVHNKSALVAPDGDVSALSHFLEFILTDQRLKEKIREGGVVKSKEYPLNRMEEQLVNFAAKFHTSCP